MPKPDQYVVRILLLVALASVTVQAPTTGAAQDAYFGIDAPTASFPPVVTETLPPVDPSMAILPDTIYSEPVPLVDPEGEILVDDQADCFFDPIGAPYEYRGSGRAEISSWIVGTGDRLGIFSLQLSGDETTEPGQLDIRPSMGIHWVIGPNVTDMPPQLYDFVLNARKYGVITDGLIYDLAIRIGYFADFQGSAREGLRIPGQATVYYRVSDSTDLVLGVDYVARDDLDVLPVGGLIFRPNECWRLEAVFPRPRFVHRLPNDKAIYLAGEMGGHRWATERDSLVDDVVNYRDFRILLGVQTNDHDQQNFWEVGYIIDRRLDFRSGVGSYKPLDTTILRLGINF